MKKQSTKFLLLSLLAISTMFMSCVKEIHQHTYSDKWTSDDEYHWHAAICEHTDLNIDKAEHTWDTGKVTTEPTEKTEGVRTYECSVCKKTKTEVIAKLAHTHTASDDWVYDATQHWHVCSGCEEKVGLENHTWNQGVVTKEATESKKGEKLYTCTTCNATKQESIPKVQPALDPNDPRSYDINPKVKSITSASQDFIFNVNSVGKTTITIRRSEWNKMLAYYDYFYKNENSVLAESYTYEKSGQKWELNTVGLRLRGNTSRYRPQGKDKKTDECGNEKYNYSWDQGYYDYAKDCDDNDYRQSHFKVDFEPLSGDDRKMSDCMKGVALKRSDGLFSKEIFCYYLFHQYGIWTAPRACRTKVLINIIEDVAADNSVQEDKSLCSITKLDYGVYEMFEEVNKQSLKGRMKKKSNNSAANAWLNNEGDLWKCAGGDLTSGSISNDNFGCEDIKIFNTDQDKSAWTVKWDRYTYDLKSNKSSLAAATANFQNFITELNDLSNQSYFTQAGINARKAFYEKWFDVDFFIKTYAVNMLVGMDDDYWGNANNYYLYFDNGPEGSGKCYFIPFDYDNTLGGSISGDKVVTNPFEWGQGKDRPLLDRLIEVPEYTSKLKQALLDVSSQNTSSPWNKNKCLTLWNN